MVCLCPDVPGFTDVLERETAARDATAKDSSTLLNHAVDTRDLTEPLPHDTRQC
jgi:hypothetical protein